MFTLVVVCFVFIIFPAASSDCATALVQTILVNNMVLQAHRTYIYSYLSEKNVAYTAEYQYVDGDVVNVTCINFFNQMPLTMEYVMAGKKSYKSTMEGLLSNEMIGFITKLHSGHNNSYMICTRTEPTDYCRVTVRFVLRKEFNTIKIAINGMTVRPQLMNVNNSYYEIEYKYRSHELMNVECEVQGTDVGLDYLVSDGKLSSRSMTVRGDDLVTTKFERSFSLELTDDRKIKLASYSITDKSAKEIYTIRFTAGTFSSDPYPLDMELPSNGIVMELYNDFKLKVIFYEFEDGEILQFKCGVPSRRTVPNDSGDVIVEAYAPPTIIKNKYLQFNDSDETDMNVINKTLQLTGKNDNTEIVCYLKEQIYSMPKQTNEDLIISKEDSVLKEIRVILREKSRNSYTLVYCLTAAGVGVIILLIISYWCCKRSGSEGTPPVATTRPHPDTVFYENLLSVFRPINEREAAELENHYEEIE